MIDFACKQFELEEVVKCGLGLTKADCKICMFMIQNPEEEYTTEEIAKKKRLNLSTVQRAVKRLNEQGVLVRTQQNLEGGGYVYYYRSIGKKKIRIIVNKILHSWTDKVDEALKNW